MFYCSYKSIWWLFLLLFFSVPKKVVRWEMAPAEAAGYWRGCHSLCWRSGNRNIITGAICWHFHQWKNPSWKICEPGNNGASKSISINNPFFFLFKYMFICSQIHVLNGIKQHHTVYCRLVRDMFNPVDIKSLAKTNPSSTNLIKDCFSCLTWPHFCQKILHLN